MYTTKKLKIDYMAQRFTDSNKWLDNWFSNLSNDYKIVWLYLLDICDNAGIFQINIRLLNFNCGTNITEAELLETFRGRIHKLNADKCIVNKFCVFQYGPDFLNSKNKAVISAIKKLIIAGLLDVDSNGIYTPLIPFNNTIDTLSIPYQMSIDTPKDKEEDKDKDKIEDKNKAKNKFNEEEFDKIFNDVK